MKCTCVRCGKHYAADAELEAELIRFYLAHRRKAPAESPWICDNCWKSFEDKLPNVGPDDLDQPELS